MNSNNRGDMDMNDNLWNRDVSSGIGLIKIHTLTQRNKPSNWNDMKRVFLMVMSVVVIVIYIVTLYLKQAIKNTSIPQMIVTKIIRTYLNSIKKIALNIGKDVSDKKYGAISTIYKHA